MMAPTGLESAQPVNILLVDDIPANLIALKAILERPDYRLLTASSGEEALRLALRHQPDVILLDVVMPEMDGFEVARHLKQIERTRDIPILFLTAVATDVHYVYTAYDVGAVDYLVKPLDAEVVRRKVSVFAELVRQREEIARQARVLREIERREYELRLAELRMASDTRYRKLVEGIDHAIAWTVDESGRLTFISRQACRILGYSLQEFMNPDFWATHLHPDDRDTVLAQFRKTLLERTDILYDHRIVAADGRVLWFHTGISGEKSASGAPELHGISVDVTEIKRAEELAQRESRAREELLAIVSHDLRNPISSIMASATLVQRAAERARLERPRESAKVILRAAKRMERLVGDLLDFAQIDAGRLAIKHGAVDAASVIGESVAMFQPLAAEKRLDLQGRANGLLTMSADRDRVLQILSNLIGNAIKFTPQGGSVLIQAERVGEQVCFAITDTGPGMPEEELSRIGARFWQARKTAEGGVGLGLFIAKGLVEAHGGQIWADSRVGVGTTFYFSLPLATDEVAPPGPAREPDSPGEPGPPAVEPEPNEPDPEPSKP